MRLTNAAVVAAPVAATKVLLFVLICSTHAQHPIKRCNVTWAAPALPAGISLPTAKEYTCMLSQFALPPDFNASWPCAAVGHKQCTAQLDRYDTCAPTDCYNATVGPGHKCGDTEDPACVCVASLLCANNSPPPTESNEGCAPMFINHCPKHCGIFVPCSA